MKSICGYWVLDGAPVPDATLAAMRVAGLRTSAPHLQAWRSADGRFFHDTLHSNAMPFGRCRSYIHNAILIHQMIRYGLHHNL